MSFLLQATQLATQYTTGLPSVIDIHGQICQMYSNGSMIAGNGLPCYQMSNGSWIASAVKVSYYTDAEIQKIIVAGGIAITAVAVLFYSIYAWWRGKYKAWQRQQELEARVEAGEVVDPTEYPEPPAGLNRKLLMVVGILIMIAGVAVYIMP